MKHSEAITVGAAAASLFVIALVVTAGDLNPPAGPIAPTMKTLEEVEPRTPISSLPFTINSQGSYFLTSALVGQAGQDGIVINTSEVTLDLNGFTLLGIPGSGSGIRIAQTSQNIFIRNGKIVNWGGPGIDGNSLLYSHLQNLHVSNCDDDGVVLGFSNTIQDCKSHNNMGDGFESAHSCSYTHCSAQANIANGFLLETGSVITGSNAAFNVIDGIRVAGNALIDGCVATTNIGSNFTDTSGGSATIVNSHAP